MDLKMKERSGGHARPFVVGDEVVRFPRVETGVGIDIAINAIDDASRKHLHPNSLSPNNFLSYERTSHLPPRLNSHHSRTKTPLFNKTVSFNQSTVAIHPGTLF